MLAISLVLNGYLQLGWLLLLAAIISPWLTIEEARRVAKCGAKLLYSEIAAGRLREARLGSRRAIRVHKDWISAWLENCAEPQEDHFRKVSR